MKPVSAFFAGVGILLCVVSVDAQTHQSQIIIEHAPQSAPDKVDSHSLSETQSSPRLLMGVSPHGVQPFLAIPLGNNIPPEKRDIQINAEKNEPHEEKNK